MGIKTIIENNDTVAGRRFDFFIQLLIVISILLFSAETLPNLDAHTLYVMNIIEAVIVVIFTLEYLLRVYVADKKLRYIFSFYGMIDLLAILPFYIFSMQGLWVLRILRVFMLLKLLRYNAAMKRFSRAFVVVHEEIVVFSLMTMMLLYLSAVGIYYFEHDAQPEVFNSIFHSLWWSVATLTTVGYGDVYPITMGGRIFTFFVLMMGLGIVAVPAGLFASALSKVRREEREEKDKQRVKTGYCSCCGRASGAKKEQN